MTPQTYHTLTSTKNVTTPYSVVNRDLPLDYLIPKLQPTLLSQTTNDHDFNLSYRVGGANGHSYDCNEEDNSQYPKCIGAIDGKHIAMKRTPNAGSYFFQL